MLVHVQLVPSEIPSQPSELDTKGTLTGLKVAHWVNGAVIIPVSHK